MNKNKPTDVVILPENRSPESIADVVSVLVIHDDRGMGFVDTEHISLSGTVKQKLKQYKEATGRDWPGTSEAVIRKRKKVEMASINLGKSTHEVRVVHPETAAAQKKIDALTKRADKYLEQDREYKKKAKRPETIEV